jgi:hypothetical protein
MVKGGHPAARNAANLECLAMSNMQGAGLAQLVQEIKLASANIRTADDETRRQIRAIEDSVNDLYRKVGRPGGYADDNESEARKSAIGLCQIHKAMVAEGDVHTADYMRAQPRFRPRCSPARV